MKTISIFAVLLFVVNVHAVDLSFMEIETNKTGDEYAAAVKEWASEGFEYDQLGEVAGVSFLSGKTKVILIFKMSHGIITSLKWEGPSVADVRWADFKKVFGTKEPPTDRFVLSTEKVGSGFIKKTVIKSIVWKINNDQMIQERMQDMEKSDNNKEGQDTSFKIGVAQFNQGNYYLSLVSMKKGLTSDSVDAESGAKCFFLAAIYFAQGNAAESDNMYARALSIFNRPDSYDKEMISTIEKVRLTQRNAIEQNYEAIRKENAAKELYKSGKYKSAISLFDQALSIKVASLGPSHAETAACLYSLAMSARNQGEYDAAKEYCVKSIAIREKLFGKDDLSVARVLNVMGTVCYHKAEYKEAEPIYARAIQIFEANKNEARADLAYSLDCLGALYAAVGQGEKAEVIFARAKKLK